MVEQLDGNRPVTRFRLLNEVFVLFRDETGRYGLLDRHCAHRGADLSFGRVEDGGLRCPFHGGLFDVAGTCLDQPAEPVGSNFRNRQLQPAYPSIFTSFDAPVDKARMREQRLRLYELPDYVPRKNRSNDYGFDPYEQRTATHTGMGTDINVHDQWAVESMGPIQDQTKEHLGQTDKAINACFKGQFGGFFIDYFSRLKEAEIDRFLSEVTDWEHPEYFSLL